MGTGKGLRIDYKAAIREDAEALAALERRFRGKRMATRPGAAVAQERAGEELARRLPRRGLHREAATEMVASLPSWRRCWR